MTAPADDVAAIRAGLTRLRPQLVRHTDGWEVGTADRFHLRYTEAGRSALIGMETGRDPGGNLVLHLDPGDFSWEPAAQPLAPDERARLLPRIVAATELLGAVPVVDGHGPAGS